MAIYDIIIRIMGVFALIGGIDRILGNRLGLGKQFEEGILAMGSLALAMIGVISLAPVLASLLKPVVVPLYSLLGEFVFAKSMGKLLSFVQTVYKNRYNPHSRNRERSQQ